MRKPIIISVVGMFFMLIFLFPWLSFAEDNDPHKTGLIERTPEEIAIEAKTKAKVKKIHLNKMGLERVNEYRRKHNLPVLDIQSFPMGQDLETVVGEGNVQLSAAESASTEAAPGTLPSSVDNSTLKYFPPIRSQGGIGSCGSFSGTYYAMTYMYALANDLDAKNGGDIFRLSPKWTYNMVNGGTDSGSWYYWCYDIGIKNGIAAWSEFPYDGSDYRSWCLLPQTWKNAISRRFNQYGYVGNVGQDAGMTQIKQLLLNGYVLNFATYINSWRLKAIANDPSTTADDVFVGKNCCYFVNGTNGYHAMTIVGYNDDIWVDINGNALIDPGEKGAFLIANSWGAGWGNSGFMWLAYDAVRDSTAVSGWTPTGRTGSAWSVVYWVTAKTGYTPKVIAQFTVNHLQRNQMGIFLGSSAPTQTTPSSKLYSKMLYLQGGPYAFNGSTAAVDGTFCLDFTDLVSTGTTQKYYLGAYDSVSGNQLALKSYQIIDLTTVPSTQIISNDTPKTADANTVYSAVSYQYGANNILPVVAISAAPTSGYSPLTVSFSSSGSYDPDGTIVSYDWDFGDGISGTGANITHTYSGNGNFNATLTVTDNLGGSASGGVTVSVADGNPVAVINATPISGDAPLTVSFSSANSTDPLSAINGFAWNFGDGSTSTLQNPLYTYNIPGAHIAVLTVTDERGLTGSSSVTITVKDPNVISSPSNLSAIATGTTVTLSWSDNASNEQGFFIERGVKSKNVTTYSKIGTVNANITTFGQTVANGTYYYRVQAFNASTGKVSGYSNEIQITVGSKGRK